MRKIVFVIFLFMSAWSCNPFNVCNLKESRQKLNSKDADKIIRGSYCVGELKDTGSVINLLKNMDDPRITHLLPYYGKSVYQIKTEALYKISGIKPPTPITSDPDSLIIKFYYKWAEDSGLIK